MLSQTVEYALRAMVHMASLRSMEWISSEAVASRTNVPRGYLSKLMRDLVIAGLVESQRGPKGGFRLAKPTTGISLLDVVKAVDPFKRIESCPLGLPDHLNLCALHKKVDDAMAHVENAFGAASLADVLRPHPGAGQCQTLTAPTLQQASVERGVPRGQAS